MIPPPEQTLFQEMSEALLYIEYRYNPLISRMTTPQASSRRYCSHAAVLWSELLRLPPSHILCVGGTKQDRIVPE